MKILVLGGDGYLGWPTALHLSARGHEVTVVDNLVRREYDREMGVDSLVPIASLPDRVTRWEQVSGHAINVRIGNLTDAAFTYGVVAEAEPDAIVHFGEQRSAPYSMIDREHAVYTQVNNVVGTLNLMYAIRRDRPRRSTSSSWGRWASTAIPNIDIEEGFIEITHKGRTDVLPYPKQPGSFYHLSKVHDSHNIMFACRVWGLRCDRPEPGHRLRPVHRGDRPRPGAGDPLRLRRRVRHRAQPLLRAGRHRASADRLRRRRPDARHAQHPRHAGLRDAGAREPGRARRVPGLQPVHRVLLGARHGADGQAGLPDPGRHRRGSVQPPGRARGALLPRRQHQAARPRPASRTS